MRLQSHTVASRLLPALLTSEGTSEVSALGLRIWGLGIRAWQHSIYARVWYFGIMVEVGLRG